jgi:hypothetical protein
MYKKYAAHKYVHHNNNNNTLAPQALCQQRAYAFDMYANTYMHNHVRRSIAVENVEECMQRCLDETQFVCQSINVHRVKRFVFVLIRCDLL